MRPVTVFSSSLSDIPSSKSSSKSNKRAKTSSAKKDEEFSGVKISMNQHVALTFSLKYLVNFSKSSSLTSKVELRMSNDVPLLVCFFLMLSTISANLGSPGELPL